jgi:hypothetical protein
MLSSHQQCAYTRSHVVRMNIQATRTYEAAATLASITLECQPLSSSLRAVLESLWYMNKLSGVTMPCSPADTHDKNGEPSMDGVLIRLARPSCYVNPAVRTEQVCPVLLSGQLINNLSFMRRTRTDGVVLSDSLHAITDTVSYAGTLKQLLSGSATHSSTSTCVVSLRSMIMTCS